MTAADWNATVFVPLDEAHEALLAKADLPADPLASLLADQARPQRQLTQLASASQCARQGPGARPAPMRLHSSCGARRL